MRLINRLSAGLPAALVCGAACLGSAVPAAAQELGSITGTFVLEGEIPELPPKVKADENVKDGAVCAVKPVPDQTIVVDPETKGLANVFIWIDDFDADDIPAELAKPKQATVTLDQKGCVFIPHAVFARTGQTLVLLNDDPVAHNAHVNAIRGDSINPLIAANDRKGVKHLLEEGDILPVPVTCDIHPWMRANLLVLEHPYGAVSGAEGKFEITGIPPGEYDLKIWQESAGYLRGLNVKEVTIEAGKATDLGKISVDAKDLK